MKFLPVFALFVCAAAEHLYVRDDNTNTTCIIIDANINVTVTFAKTDGSGTETCNVALVNATSVTGECHAVEQGVAVQRLTALFYPNGVKSSMNQPWEMNLTFTSDEKSKEAFRLVDWKLATTPVKAGICDSATSSYFKKSDTAMIDVHAESTNAFQCSDSRLALTNNSFFDFSDMKAIAFAKIDGDTFPNGTVYERCFADSKTSDIVPIIVGACLAGLVVVVLVAYLIGRARAKRQGYASV